VKQSESDLFPLIQDLPPPWYPVPKKNKQRISTSIH
jgi:hypothetical protein